MGGSRAKENRRVKRQADRDKVGGGGGDDGAATASNIRPPKRPGGGADRRSSDNDNGIVKPQSRQISNPSAKPAKKKTIKKPKHLKRKLATVTDATDEATLRQKLADFEHQKEARKSKKIKTSAEDKTITKSPIQPSSEHSGTDDNEIDVSSRPPIVTTTAAASTTTTNTPAQSKDTIVPSKSSPRIDDEKNSDDSSVEDDDKPVIQHRQRGKRRRGRKDTSQKVAEEETETTEPIATPSTTTPMDDETNTTNKKKRGKPDRDMSRYCIGRKPITDFEVGKTYNGSVKYVKSFGLFLDINCHFDAFCHVSWLQDDYIDDPTALFKEGDEVQARVVDIDRHKKRITVSMQSESFMEMELKSLGSNKDYKDKKAQKLFSRQRVPRSTYSDSARATALIQTEKRFPHHNVSSEKDASTVPSPTITSQSKRSISTSTHQPPGSNTPAELKRERKLARRAERRAKKE